MLTALLGLLLVGSFAYAEESDDEAKQRLLKEYEKVQKEKEKEAEEAAKRQAEEGTQSVQEIANQATENADGTVVEGGEVAVAQEVTFSKAWAMASWALAIKGLWKGPSTLRGMTFL